MTEHEMIEQIVKGVDYFTFCNMVESLPEGTNFTAFLYGFLTKISTPHRTEFALMIVENMDLDYLYKENNPGNLSLFGLIFNIYLKSSALCNGSYYGNNINERISVMQENSKKMLKIAYTKVTKEEINDELMFMVDNRYFATKAKAEGTISFVKTLLTILEEAIKS